MWFNRTIYINCYIIIKKQKTIETSYRNMSGSLGTPVDRGVFPQFFEFCLTSTHVSMQSGLVANELKKQRQSNQEKQRGRTKARKGKERACKNIFNDPLLLTFGSMRCQKVKLSICQLAGKVLLLPACFLSSLHDSYVL